MTSVEQTQRQFIDAVATIVPFSRACIYSVDAGLQPYGHVPYDGDSQWSRRYSQFREVDPFHPRYFAQQQNSIFCTSEGAAPMLESELYIQGFRQPMGMAYKLEIFLRDRSHRIKGGIRLSRARELGDFTEAERHGLRQLQPVLSRAWGEALKETRLKTTLTLMTARESEVFECLLTGMSNPEIARELTMSLPTVKSHVGNILRKAEVNSRSELLAFYR